MKEINRQKNEVIKGAVYDSIEGKAKQALSKIGNRVSEIGSNEQRVQAMVDKYLSLSAVEQKNYLLLIPDNITRKIVTDKVRNELQVKGTIGANELETTTLLSSSLFPEERAYSSLYREGQVVKFEKDYVRSGITQGYYTVEGIGDGNNVILKNSEGKTLSWNPEKAGGRTRFVNVYDRQNTNIARNDEIRWKDSNKDIGLKNGDTGVIQDIKGSELTVKFKNGLKKIDTKDERFKHFEHAIASTVYNAQGATYDGALVMMESWRKNLINQQSFYVSLSRVRHDIHVFTDDKQKLGKEIENRTGANFAALEQMKVNYFSKEFSGDKVTTGDKGFNKNDRESFLTKIKNAIGLGKAEDTTKPIQEEKSMEQGKEFHGPEL